MKKLVLLLFIPFVFFGQVDLEPLSIEKIGERGCFNLKNEKNFFSLSEAREALNQILFYTDFEDNFFLQPCTSMKGTPAAALLHKGNRFIFYDEYLLRQFGYDKWYNFFVLAHEVGHHYLEHFDLELDELQKSGNKQLIENKFDEIKALEKEKLMNNPVEYYKEKQYQELQCDEFGGIILALVGADYADVENFVNKNNDIFWTGYDTDSKHPSAEKRLEAILNGMDYYFYSNLDYDRVNNFGAGELFRKRFGIIHSENENYYYSSIKKYMNNDLDGAYSDFLAFKGIDANSTINEDEDDEFNSLIKEINNSNYRGRCQATTKTKSQCKRTAKSGFSFCWQHNDGDDSDLLIGRCKATTKAGLQCKRRASENKEFCWQH